ncbi:Ig-like domain-containing protein [Sessilibacter sp. MAH4]
MNAKYLASCASLLLLAVHGASAQFVNQPQTPGELISKSHPELGRLTTIEILGDLIIAIPEIPSSTPEGDFVVRAIDISDPKNPVTVNTFGMTRSPILAHGTYKRGNEVYLGGFPNDAVRLEPDGSVVHAKWTGPDAHFNKSGMMHPWAARHWWSYGEVSGLSWLQLDGEVTAEWDHLGLTGVIGFPSFMGNLMLYSSDQTFSGMAAYDVSDPTNPVLLDVLKLPDTHPTITIPRFINGQNVNVPAPYGLGGYWSEIYGHYMVFARRGDNPGVQVVDFSDPTNLRVHCEVFYRDPARNLVMDTAIGSSYMGFQDEFIFSEQLKINVETCEAQLLFKEIENELETSQYSRPLGNMMLSGGGHNYLIEGRGIASGGLGIWAHQAEPDTRPPFVAYHIPKRDQTNYPLMAPISFMIPETLRTENIVVGENIRLTEVGGDQVPVDYLLSHTGVLTVDPLELLKPDTTYEMTLVGIEDAVHNPMEEFTFRFSTGSEVQSAVPVIRNVRLSAATLLPNDPVTVTVDAVDADGDSLEYRFRRSAGEAYGPWSSASSATFTYADLGNFSINVQVRDPSNNIATSVTNVAVVETLLTQETTLSSSPLALSFDGAYVWVANPDNDTIAQLAIDTHEKSSVGEVFVGKDPRSLATDTEGRLWVTLHDDDAIAVLDSAGNRLETIETGYGSAPFGVVVSRAGDFAYVSLYNSGKIVKVDTTTMTIVAETTQKLPTVKALALTEDGTRLVATRFISDDNWGEVWIVDTATMAIQRTVKLDQNLVPDQIDNGRGVPNYIGSVVIDSEARFAYVAGKKDNTGSGLVNGNPDLDDDNTVRTFAAQIDLTSGLELRESRIDFDNADSPSALTLVGDDQYLLVAMQGGNQVFVVNRDGATGALGVSASRIASGLAPQGLLFDGLTEQLMVKNFTERTVTFVDLSNFLRGSIVNPASDSVSTVANEVLSDEVLLGKQIFYSAVLDLNTGSENRAKTSAEGYLSCATCHLDGDQDGRAWDFTGRNEGVRNNITLNGRMGARFGFMHWSGNFDEVHDFEIDIRERFVGRGLMTDEQYEATGADNPMISSKAGVSSDLDALAAYVESLGKDSLARSPYRDPVTGQMTEQALRGREVFESAGCVQCHSPIANGDGFFDVGAFTDGQIHNIGTTRSYSGSRLGEELPGIKTPSLLGVFKSAPYLHDGSAPDLESVFTGIGGQVIEAESLSSSGSAVQVVPESFSYLRGGAGVRLSGNGSLSISAASPGAPFNGFVRVRYGSVTQPANLKLTINGQELVRALEVLPTVGGEDVNFRETTFSAAFIGNQQNATLSIESTDGTASAVIDTITVSTRDAVTNAAPHLAFNSLSSTEKDELLAFVMQLDTQNAAQDDVDLGIVTTIVESTENPNPGNGNGGNASTGETETESTGGSNPVSPTNEEPGVAGSSDSGSGSYGAFALLLLPLLLLRRRRQQVH